MTKRAYGKFKKRKHDLYETPVEDYIFKPLIPHLPKKFRYNDPCYGKGNIHKGLIQHFSAGLAFKGDINPQCGAESCDATKDKIAKDEDFNITNPAWTRPIRSAIIANLSSQLPTWLLYDADWMHNVWATEHLKYCHKIISVGRVSWMGNGVKGFDNAAWYLFDQKKKSAAPKFYGRI